MCFYVIFYICKRFLSIVFSAGKIDPKNFKNEVNYNFGRSLANAFMGSFTSEQLRDFALKGGMSFGMKKVITDVARDQIQYIKKETEAQKSINNKEKNNTFAQDKQNNTQEDKKAIQQKNNDTIRNAYLTKQDSTLIKDGDMRFEKFIPYIEESEGGYSDRKNDRGGKTNRGISWKTWVAYAKPILGLEPTVDNLKVLSKDDANKIYRKIFWEDKKIHKINNEKVAYILFDWGVHSGNIPIFNIQRILNNDFNKSLKIDGSLGPETIKTINSIEDPELLIKKLNQARFKFYDEFTNQPDQKENKKGFENRANKFYKVKF